MPPKQQQQQQQQKQIYVRVKTNLLLKDLSAVTMLHQILSQMSSMGNRLLEIETNGIKMSSNLAMLDTMVGNNVI